MSLDLENGLSYKDAVQWIYDLSKKERSGMRLGLESIKGLCKRVGDPQDSFPSVHIAGTNGKGSVAHMMEAVLSTDGEVTGLYTSPHLQTFCERVWAEGRMITEQEIVDIARVLFPHVEAMGFGPTFFDVTTALAFMHFRDRDVSKAIIEVGLGGRLDSTNVLKDVDVCVVTNVGMEHTDVLGKDLGRILWEKASIIKKDASVVVGDVGDELMHVIQEMAKDRGAMGVHRCHNYEVLESRIDGLRIGVQGRRAVYDIELPLMGEHQALNAAIAVTALESMAVPPSPSSIAKGLKGVQVPGRLEIVRSEPFVIIDCAHNPPASRRLAATVRDLFGDRKVVALVGMMQDKDVGGFMDALIPVTDALVATMARSDRACRPEDISAHAKERLEETRVEDDVEGGLRVAMDMAGRDGVVLATGSFYVAGEVRQVFRPVKDYL